MSHDKQFVDTFMLIIGALVVFTFAMIALANMIGGGVQKEFLAETPEAIAAIEKRIAPVGRVAVAGETEPPAPEPRAMAAAAAEPDARAAPAPSGEDVYNSACMACHAAGIAGAPRVGDVPGWEARIARGIDALYANAINGYIGEAGAMPAKGGRVDLSDEAVRAAVDYMVDASR